MARSSEGHSKVKISIKKRVKIVCFSTIKLLVFLQLYSQLCVCETCLDPGFIPSRPRFNSGIDLELDPIPILIS